MSGDATLGADDVAATVVFRRESLLRFLWSRWSTRFALVWLGITLVAAIVPTLFTRVDPLDQDLSKTLKGPIKGHLLGTDTLGRDILSRMVHGTRPTVIGALIALVVAVSVGVTFGLLSGYLGGAVDAVISRFAEILFSIPALIVLLVVYSVFPYNVVAAMTTFGVIVSAGLARLVRGVTLSTKEELFVAAAQVSGLSQRQIMARHLFPRVRALVLVQASILAAIAILVQSGLAFIGFGPRPPAPTWGSEIATARSVLTRQNWMLLPTGGIVALTVFALTMLGDALRDRSTESWAPSKFGRRRKGALLTAGTASITGAASSQVSARVSSTAPSGSGADEPALLSIRGLSVAFPGPSGLSPVVDDVSFDVAAGEIVGIVGESGCGKTVTAVTLLGMVPGNGEVTAGVCSFEGRDVLSMSPKELESIRGRRIGFVSQEPMVSMDPTYRVGAQIAEAVRRHHGLSRKDAKARVRDLFVAVNLPDPDGVARRYAHQLSGGMAQRVAIALALAGDPALLIADEPTTALDVTVQSEILTLLRRLSRDRGMAVLLVTHNWGVVADLCDRALVMYAGEIVESATVEELFLDARHPYTRGLLRSNPLLAKDNERLPAIPGTVPPPGSWPVGCHFAARCEHAAAGCWSDAVRLTAPAPGRVVRCVRADELRVDSRELRVEADELRVEADGLRVERTRTYGSDEVAS